MEDWKKLKPFLDEQWQLYERSSFIEEDPISIPKQFYKLQDIEISGLITAILSWGQRTTILKKCNELMDLMDRSTYDYILNAEASDLSKLEHFKHRTFNSFDLFYFIKVLKSYYLKNDSLETIFSVGKEEKNIEKGLINFRKLFFENENEKHRTKKHIATPARKSACKRLNMFLRWMVRSDDRGVDFKLWKTINPKQLICPMDLHVIRISKDLGLLNSDQSNWKIAVELTEKLAFFDPNDPVKYDFALFGMGVNERSKKNDESSIF